MNEVERIHEELAAIEKIIAASSDASASAAYGEHSAKALLLAGASYFERKVISAIEAYLGQSTSTASMKHFTFHQAIDRKFFSLFDFSAGAKSINGFIAKFGDEFSVWAKNDLQQQGVDRETQLAFLDFCRLRNSLVHNNYATFAINKTMREVKEAFDAASKVVIWIDGAFDKFELGKKSVEE